MTERHRVFTTLGAFWLLASPGAASAQDSTFHSGTVTIRYVDRGAGEPVVLIHGYSGSVERHWVTTGVLDSLMKDHRVIALDLRGHGKSDKPHDPAEYGPQMAQDVVRLLDHLEIRRAHLVGYSLGAALVTQLVASNPDRVETATLVAGAGYHSWSSRDEDVNERAAAELEGPVPFRSLIVTLTPSGEPTPSDDDIRAKSRALEAVNDVHALAALTRNRRGLVSSIDRIVAAQVPMLGVVGSADGALGSIRQLQSAVPTLSVVIVDGASHGGDRSVLKRPEFLTALRSFLDKHHDAH